MENNDKLKEINTKNGTYYYIDDITKFEDFDINNILIGKKLYENYLVCTKH